MFSRIFTLSNLTLLVALSISAIAAWYSIIGLTAIFAGAVIPIIIMGSVLEVAKITTTVWLHKYWKISPLVIKIYLVPAVVALAMLTSMGIFGFLSKAHIDQGVSTGDVGATVLLLDEKIKTQRENINSARQALLQLDNQVNNVMNKGDSERSAERSVQIRRQQGSERVKLQKEIEIANKEIAKLNEERAPIASELRKVEAEVGPIKYIAAFIYGDNPDQNVLERAVRWVIILLVIVFDPLAIILVLAASQSKVWDKAAIREETAKIVEQQIVTTVVPEAPVVPEVQKIIEPLVAAPSMVVSVEEQQALQEVYKTLEPIVVAKVETPELVSVITTEEDEAFKLIEQFNAKRTTKPVETVEISQTIDSMDYTVDSNALLVNSTETIDVSKQANLLIAEIEPVEIEIDIEPAYVADEGPLTQDQIKQIKESVTENPAEIVETQTITEEEIKELEEILAVTPVADDLPNYEGVKNKVTGKWEQTGPEIVEAPSNSFKILGNNYVEYEGKRMGEHVLRKLRPDLFGIKEDDPREISIGYGTEFPQNSLMGDSFIRIDTIPHVVYKNNGTKWITVDKKSSGSYLSNVAYLQHLMEKISTGEYDPDLLTPLEQDAITEHIKES